MAFKDKRAYNAVLKQRAALLVDQPFFGALALHLQLVEVEDPDICSTMMVDGKKLWYHSPFVHTLSEPELKGVLAHEVMHCVYKHMTRRKARHPVRWNWAADFVINADILEAGFTLPGKPITLKSPPGSRGHLFDPQYAGMSTEEVYERMPEMPTITIMIMGGSGGKGKKQKQNGNGDGEGDDHGNGAHLPEGADFGGCGGVIDANADDPSHSPATSDETEREWEAITRVAIAAARRHNAGTLPGYLKRLVRELARPRKTWRDETAEFIDACMKSDYSWNRPNRRFVGRGLHLPGWEPDGLHKLVFVGDTSGSITEKVMSEYLGEMQGSLDQGTSDVLICVYCDAAVHGHREYLPGDIVKYDVDGGGGGTDFRPALAWVKEHHPDANAIVYLTDMYPFSWELEDPGIPVLWAAYTPEAHFLQVQPPFGRKIYVASGN